MLRIQKRNMNENNLLADTPPATTRRSARRGDVTTSQTSSLTDLLRLEIIRGRLSPGSKLKIRDIATKYGSGTIPTREALSRLVRSGFVDFEDQKGFRVRHASTEELKDLSRVRILIETEALRDAIAHADIAWEARILGALHQMSRLPIYNSDNSKELNVEWENAHDTFHKELISNCSSECLKTFAQTLREQTARYRHLSVRAAATPSRDIRVEHKDIVDAVLERDADKACSLLEKHLRLTASIAMNETRSINSRVSEN